MAIHLCGRPEGWAARLSPGKPGGSPSYLALLPVELARFTPPGPESGRHRHCGAGPRLAAGGRYPLPCAVELGLSSRRRVAPSSRGHPIASLAGAF